MDDEVKDILVQIMERLQALESRSDEDAILLNQLALALQSNPKGETALSLALSKAREIVSRRRASVPDREFVRTIQRLRER
jgi:hypothetical protein